MPVDESINCHRAFNWLLKYIYTKTDFIIFAHVLQPRAKRSDVFISPDNLINIPIHDFSLEADSVISKYRKLAEQAQVNYSIEVLSDSSVAEAILRLAMNTKVNLIVVGSRGVGKARLGSVSRHLVTHSSVPVLVVPPSTKKQSNTIF